MNYPRTIYTTFRMLPNEALFGLRYECQDTGDIYEGRGLGRSLMIVQKGSGAERQVAYNTLKNVPLSPCNNAGGSVQFYSDFRTYTDTNCHNPIRSAIGKPFISLQNSSDHLMKSYDGFVWFSVPLTGFRNRNNNTENISTPYLCRLKEAGGYLYLMNNNYDNSAEYLHVSTDNGVSWKPCLSLNNNYNLDVTDVLYSERYMCWYFIATNKIYRSFDGIQWEDNNLFSSGYNKNRAGLLGDFILGIDNNGVLAALNLNNLSETYFPFSISGNATELVITNNNSCLIFCYDGSSTGQPIIEVNLTSLLLSNSLDALSYLQNLIIERMPYPYASLSINISMSFDLYSCKNAPIVYGSSIMYYTSQNNSFVISRDHGRTWNLICFHKVFDIDVNAANGLSFCPDLGILFIGNTTSLPAYISSAILEGEY